MFKLCRHLHRPLHAVVSLSGRADAILRTALRYILHHPGGHIPEILESVRLMKS